MNYVWNLHVFIICKKRENFEAEIHFSSHHESIGNNIDLIHKQELWFYDKNTIFHFYIN